MDKYQAVSFLGVLQVIYILGVIVISGIFNNYWLLFLILLAGIESSEKRILGIKEKREEWYY